MLTVRTSPHDHDSISTDKAMLYVVMALLPSAIWGCVMFGFRACGLHRFVSFDRVAFG